jgi:hypothetical protein
MPFKKRVHGVEFRRGFVEKVTITVPMFLTQARVLSSLAPIRAITFRNAQGKLGRLVGVAACMRRIREIDFSPYFNFQDEDVRQLAASAYLGELRDLSLVGSFGAVAARALTESPSQFLLERLILRGLNWAGAAALFSSARMRNLRDLNLSGGSIGNAGALALANSIHVTGLLHLDLSRNMIDADGVALLAGSANLSNLVSLNLLGNAVRVAGAVALAESPYLSRLQELIVRYPGIGGEEGATVLRERFGSVVQILDQ